MGKGLPSNSKSFEGAIKGLDEIKEKLKTLEADMVKNINRSAARAGAVAIKKVADKNLPIFHRGKKKLGEVARRRVKKNIFSYKIGPKKEHWPLIFLEYGVPPHEITPKRAKALHLFEEASTTRQIRDIGVYGGWFARKVKHPGIEATHFLSRAIFEGAEEAFKAIGDQYWKRIKKAIK